MASFKNVESENGTIDLLKSTEIESEKVSADEYMGLPIASLLAHGIVKIDGTSIQIDEDGIISAHIVFDNESMENHMKDEDIHMFPGDRINLDKLDGHIASRTLHFTFQEKEGLLKDIESSKKHTESPHLSEDEVGYLKTHVEESWMHFDDIKQKEDVLNLAGNTVSCDQSFPNRVLVTNEEGSVSLSTISATTLENLPELTTPLVSYLSEYFQAIGTCGKEEGTTELENHTLNEEVHFKAEEKAEIYERLELLDLDKSQDLFAKVEDLIGFAAEEHRHTTLDMDHDEILLYSVIKNIQQDIEQLKSNIESVKNDIEELKSDVELVKSDIEKLKPSIPPVVDPL